MCYHYAIPTPLDYYCLQIMMLAVNIQLFTASLQRLQMSRNRAHEWSNSVGKKLFLRLLEAVAPHYNLWVYVVHYYPYILPYILGVYYLYYLYILPYILGVCCTLTTHSGCMFYTNYPYILPTTLTFYHTFITPMSTVHFQQVETFTNPDPPIYIYKKSVQ